VTLTAVDNAIYDTLRSYNVNFPSFSIESVYVWMMKILFVSVT
jgi:hypothetical protein